MESFRGKKMIECEGAIKTLLDKYGLTLTGLVAPTQNIKPPWGSSAVGIGIRYRVTLTNTEGKSFTYNFWDSPYAKEHGEILKGEVVLETLLSDCRCPDDYGDFCMEMGYDDSQEGRKTFNLIQKFKEGIFSVINETEWMEFSELFDVIVNP